MASMINILGQITIPVNSLTWLNILSRPDKGVMTGTREKGDGQKRGTRDKGDGENKQGDGKFRAGRRETVK